MNWRKGARTSNEDSKKVSENEENNNKELKPKFVGKINLKSGKENTKIMFRRNLNDCNQTGDDLILS